MRYQTHHLGARLVAMAVSAWLTLGCDTASPAVATLAGVQAVDAELSFCRDEVNRYRASITRPALSRSPSLEVFAATAAKVDGTAHAAHRHFTTTNGGNTASAETEILWWRRASVHAVIQEGLAQMWQEGPNGEHYQVLTGPYTEVGCGVFVGDGEITVAQDFR